MKKIILSILLCFGLLLTTMPISAVITPLTELWVANVDLLTVDAADYPAGVTFDADTNTLTLDNVNITEGYTFTNSDGSVSYTVGIRAAGRTELTILVKGACSIASDELYSGISAVVNTLTIKGVGENPTFTLLSHNDSIDVQEDLSDTGNLILKDLTMHVTSGDIAIDVSEDLTIDNVKLTVISDDECLDVTDYLTIRNSEINLNSGDIGIDVNDDFKMSDSILIIDSHDTALDASDNCKISGNSTVTASSDTSDAILSRNASIVISSSVTLNLKGKPAVAADDGTVTLGGVPYTNRCYSLDMVDGVITENLHIPPPEEYPITDLSVNDVDMLTADAADYPKGVTFDPATATLTLNETNLNIENIDGSVIWVRGNLNINLVGKNVMKDISYGIDLASDGRLTFSGSGTLEIWSSENSIYGYNNVNIVVTDEAIVSLNSCMDAIYSENAFTRINNLRYSGDDRSLEIKRNGYTNEVKRFIYSLYVDDVELINTPAESYPEGVSFDADSLTLTLTNANLTKGIYARGDLQIKLVGNNRITDATGEGNGIEPVHVRTYCTIYGDSLTIENAKTGIYANEYTVIGPVNNLEIITTGEGDAIDLFRTNGYIDIVGGERMQEIYAGASADTAQVYTLNPHSTMYYDLYDNGSYTRIKTAELSLGAHGGNLYGTYISTSDESGVIYSVDAAWGNMEFTYQGASAAEWDPATHTYSAASEAGWKWTEGANRITVTNHSNAGVNASLSYTPDANFADIDGSFTETSGKTNNDGVLELASAENTTYEQAPTASAELVLAGELDSGTVNKTTIGLVTLTLQGVIVSGN